jgi:hypothetical protein
VYTLYKCSIYTLFLVVFLYCYITFKIECILVVSISFENKFSEGLECLRLKFFGELKAQEGD